MSQTVSENLFAQITATMRNVTMAELTGKIVRVIPDSMERVTDGISRFILINMERYTNFVSNVQEGDSVALQLIGLIGYKLYSHYDTIFMYIHLILAAIFPIFVGSYASLRRPSSAGKKAPSSSDDKENNEDEPLEKAMDTLDKTDAIMFPIIAGMLLTGLYFLIKWLEDPALISLFMGLYFSLVGIGTTGKLMADALNVFTTFVFPSVFFSRGKTYRIDPLLRQQFVDSQNKNNESALHRTFRSDISTPLPGPFSEWKVLKSYSPQLWNLRALLTERWLFKGYLHGVTSFRGYVRLNDAIGLVLGAVAIALYHLMGKPWLFTNLIGFSYCYAAFQVMSPTSFSTCSLLLVGLFFYDIIMVFYTPMMVTVASSLEVPIKLVFPGPKRGSMLGLGDVVLPGLMIALALRFDLYLHYLRKQTNATSPEGQITKAHYEEFTCQWGERFWTIGAPKQDCPDTFSRVYFKAGLVGYTFGLVFTLLVLNIFNSAQPALLYLVPCVLIAIWGVAMFRGEIGLMMSYSEAAQDENKVVNSEKEGNGEKGEIKRQNNQDHAHHVFLFSLTTPRNLTSTSKNEPSETEVI